LRQVELAALLTGANISVTCARDDSRWTFVRGTSTTCSSASTNAEIERPLVTGEAQVDCPLFVRVLAPTVPNQRLGHVQKRAVLLG
jgi:hypothetical protein